MNKKHQQAFRELRDKLKQHGFILGVTHDGHLCFMLDCVQYISEGMFDGNTETVIEVNFTNHSISSEAEDE